jgi:hypothetical protein
MKKQILVPILIIIIVAGMLLCMSFGLNKIAAANAQAEHQKIMETILPGNTEFTVEPYAGDDANIRSVHKGETGFVVETVTYGYAGDITMLAYNPNMYAEEKPLLQDKSNDQPNTKYMTFICGDYAMVEITNESLPEGSSCVIIKDSYGNAFAPFLTQNYHKVYCIDYRKFYAYSLKDFVERYEIDDVIFAPYLIATQSTMGNDMFANHCR